MSASDFTKMWEKNPMETSGILKVAFGEQAVGRT